MSDAITVITLTRRRCAALDRAIASVRAQDYRGRIEHLVVIDDDPATQRHLQSTRSEPHRAVCAHLEPRPSADRCEDPTRRASVYPRLARLLNLGVRLASSSWLAFLDDDNEYEPDHLSSLVECARGTGAGAVHSARTVLWPDGAPYLEPIFPGAATEAEGRRIYELMCDRGVWVRGTNILRDRVDVAAGAEPTSALRNSTVMNAGDNVLLVDQNLWIIRRDVLERHPIPESFTDEEIAANTCPDDKLVAALVHHRVAIASSGRPTVRYYLGGVSNGFGPQLRSVAARTHGEHIPAHGQRPSHA
jgi:glycosyltransferase involved in cell wall biosynthesis